MLFINNIHAHDLFKNQWITLNIGRTQNTFKPNSGNNNGVGIIMNAGISSTIHKDFFMTALISKVKEFPSFGFDYYTPLEYFNQKAITVGHLFVVKDFCILPSAGFCWMKGINRGEWLGVPGQESYECVEYSYSSNGISWSLQFNSNAEGLVGFGLEFSGVLNSEKDYFGISLILKIGKQYTR